MNEIEKKKKIKGKGIADEEVNCNLPDELIEEILTRLPVKSLFRFKTVCKQWLSLIENPNFITLHFNQSNTNLNHNPSLFIFLVTGSKLHTSLLTYSVQQDDLPTFVAKHDLQRDALEIKACCNGLLFYTIIYRYHDMFSFVQNLSTRQQFKIPPLPRCGDFLCSHIEFGFNPHTMTYSCVHLRKSRCYLFTLPAEPGAASSWRKIASSPVKTCSDYCKCVCINGVMHWNSSKLKIITLFDLKTEEFGILEYPTNFKLSTEYTFQEFQGSLCLFLVDVEDVFNLWVLKDYDNHSWNYHRFVLPRPSPFSFSKHITHKTSIVRNWDIVVISNEKGHPYFLHSYNLRTGVSKKIEIVGISSYKVKHLDIATVGEYQENMITLTSG